MPTMFRRLLSAVLLLSLLAAAAAQDDAETAEATAVQLGESEYGTHLVDGNDKPVYLFLPDEQGEPTCEDDCLEVWPPVIVDGDPVAGEGADAELTGTVERDDGSLQLTYNGWPLYYFHLDVPNDEGTMLTLGQAQEGRWYLVTAEGDGLDADEFNR